MKSSTTDRALPIFSRRPQAAIRDCSHGLGASRPEPTSPPHAATVNGIAVGDRLGAVRELLRQRAVATGACANDADADAVTSAIDALLDREIGVPEPTPEECRRWYDAHADAFVAGELVFARHILFAVTAGTPVAPLRAKAEATLAELRSNPERFAERARELSNCPSGAQGGMLGQLSRGECVPEFERALFATTSIGVLPTLVNSRYGFHVVAIDRRVDGRQVPFEAVKDQVAARLSAAATERAVTQYVRVLAGRAQVEGIDLGSADTPLVQ